MIVTEIFTTRLARAPEAAEIEAIIDEYVPLLRAALPQSARFRLMPAVHEALDFLAAQTAVHLAVATGNVRSGARAKLEHCGLWARFAMGGGFGDDSPERPLLVLRAIERAKTTAGIDFLPERIVVVGDTPYDIHAARACGVRVMAVATGSLDRATLESHEPDVVLDTLDELPAWHRNWFSPVSAESLG
jgi:phosphoglycolate phosphatase-like HAD superfamily hydrolase